MAKSDFTSVDEYIASQPETVRDVLKRVRKAIRKAVPRAVEGILYKMPAYTLSEEPVLYFAAWKRHYSLYGATREVVASLKGELAPYKVGKGTISFQFSKPVPVKLIEHVAKWRAKEVGDRVKG